MITYRDGKQFYTDPFNSARLVPVKAVQQHIGFSGCTFVQRDAPRLQEEVGLDADRIRRCAAHGPARQYELPASPRKPL